MQTQRIKLLADTPAHLQALLEGGDIYEMAFAIPLAKGVGESLTSPEVSESFRARLRDNGVADHWRDGFGIVQLRRSA